MTSDVRVVGEAAEKFRRLAKLVEGEDPDHENQDWAIVEAAHLLDFRRADAKRALFAPGAAEHGKTVGGQALLTYHPQH